MSETSSTVEVGSGLDPNLAYKQFFKDSDWSLKTGLGALIIGLSYIVILTNPVLIPLSFCLWALICGYVLRLIRLKLKDEDSPLPVWNDWLDLVISGLTWLAVACGQLMIVASLLTFALLIGGATGSRYANSNQYEFWVLGSMSLVYGITVLIGFFSSFLMVNLAEEERVGAVFAFRKVCKRVWKHPIEFIEAWLLATGIKVLSVVLPALTIVGTILLPVTVFIAHCIEGILLAQVWAKAGEDS